VLEGIENLKILCTGRVHFVKCETMNVETFLKFHVEYIATVPQAVY
jgi:hypothetical protein